MSHFRPLYLRSARPATEAPNAGARKQPKKVPGGPRVKCRENSRKTAGGAAKQPKNSCFACFGCFSGCFSAVSPALYTGPTRHPFRLFFGCFRGPTFGASVAGRADRNTLCHKTHFEPPWVGLNVLNCPNSLRKGGFPLFRCHVREEQTRFFLNHAFS